MHMLEPRRLDNGWQKRVFLNAGRLLWRHPLLLIPIVLLPVAVGLVMQTLFAVIAAFLATWFVAPLLVIKADRGTDVSWFSLLKNLAGHWGMMAVIVAGVFLLYVGIRGDKDMDFFKVNGVGFVFGMGGSLIYLYMTKYMLSMAIMFLSLILLALWHMTGATDGAFKKLLKLMHCFPGQFTHFILAEQGGGVMLALHLSERGESVNPDYLPLHSKMHVGDYTYLLAMFCPPLFGFASIVSYFIYKEVFHGDTGLHEPAPVEASSRTAMA